MTLHHGDCLDVMRSMPEVSVDTVITDPPYGLGFMGKEWDTPGSFVERKSRRRAGSFESIQGNHNPTDSRDRVRTRLSEGLKYQDFTYVWATEALRVAKSGALLLAFGGTRTFHRLTCAIEDAGWEIRDCIMWLYGSGFPKSHNFSAKLNGNSQHWHGYGTALKPAWEPIIVAMKPCDGTFAQNAERHGVAGLWIDGSRIGTTFDDIEIQRRRSGGIMNADLQNKIYGTGWKRSPAGNAAGRWPANLILDEDAGAMLDAQSGESKSSGGTGRTTQSIGGRGVYRGGDNRGFFHLGDSGGASRFFYCAKASRSERNAGLDANHHPTVKPLKLMQYLVRLTKTPMGGIVLDPFIGSGTTGVACIHEGRKFIGIEKDAEYIKIAQARIDHAEAEPTQSEMVWTS